MCIRFVVLIRDWRLKIILDDKQHGISMTKLGLEFMDNHRDWRMIIEVRPMYCNCMIVI